MPASALVVGAGINGLLIGLELVRRGWTVRILDRGGIPNERSASHGRHRLIHPWKSKGHGELSDAKLALALRHELLSEIGYDGFVGTGVIVVNSDEITGVLSKAYSRSAENISYDDTCKLMPQLAGGRFLNSTLYPEYGCLLADQILYALAEYLSKQGVGLLPHQDVHRIDQFDGRVVLSNGDKLQADLVFVSAGAGTGHLTGMREPSGGYKGTRA
ncbi:NAD(P)/FAD-dependent oxidoreductase [Microvirga sp. M2]|uniref:NAD(P)/FAD-dependent oxidoreductase n=1 Tax=Microvirga sp. M2 TaxID=3073270 RepID=UPI0039C34EBE